MKLLQNYPCKLALSGLLALVALALYVGGSIWLGNPRLSALETSGPITLPPVGGSPSPEFSSERIDAAALFLRTEGAESSYLYVPQ